MEIGDKVRVLNYGSVFLHKEGIIEEINQSDGVYGVRIDDALTWFKKQELRLVDEDTNSHYKKLAVQPVKLARMILTDEEFRGAMKFNIIKYCMRAGLKTGEAVPKELQKAEDYLRWLHEVESGEDLTL